MSTPSATTAPVLYLPQLFDLKKLFKNPLDSKKDFGFDHGSTVLIAGAPGLGRTVISLSMVRDLLGQFPKSKLYYVTTEMDHESLLRRYRNYGWFIEDEDKYFGEERCRIIHIAEHELPQPTGGAGVLISKVINDIRSDRNRVLQSAASRSASHDSLAFVIVDSVTALLKDSRDPGDRRRNVQELIVGLKQAIGEDELALVFLTSEEPASATPAEIHLADVVFEVGLHDTGSGSLLRTLEVTKCHGRYLPMGLHTWATINKENAVGVFASQDLREHVEEIAIKTQSGEGATANWGTIVVFPRPRFPAIGKMQSTKEDPNNPDDKSLDDTREVSTGIPGLDEMIRGESEYWSQSAGQALWRLPTASIFPGSTTIFIGCSGTGKSTALLQILHNVEPLEAKNGRLAKLDSDGRLDLAEKKRRIHTHEQRCADALLNPRSGEDRYADHALYVNFENRPSRIKTWFPLDKAMKATFFDDKSGCHMLYRRRANLDFNALLAEIEFIIERHEVRRVAIDGLSDLLATHTPFDFARITEALLLTIRAASKVEPKSIFIGLETDVASLDSSALEAISFAADNVVLLRNVSINDEQRKTIQVIKARGHSPDPQIRELIVTGDSRFPLRVVPGLEDYSGLHSAEPRPVKVAVQLLAENAAENRCNQLLLDRLRRQFGHPIEPFEFSRPEIQSTLADMAAGATRIPSADIKILSIDEWLIRDLRIASAEASRARTGSDNALRAEVAPPLLQLDAPAPPSPSNSSSSSTGVRPPSNHWFFEAEKATALVYHPPSMAGEKEGYVEAKLMALPNYSDYGMFCLNPRLAACLTRFNGGTWPQLLDTVPRQWGIASGNWFKPPDDSGNTIVGLMQQFRDAEKDKNDTDAYGFTFDMETPVSTACAFLEFCWAFGAPEDFLVRGIQKRSNRSRRAVRQALLFLQYLVLHDLMPKRAKHSDADNSLFSRHWYSSLQDVLKRNDRVFFDDSHTTFVGGHSLVPLPFFPIGAFESRSDGGRSYCPDALQDAVYDMLMRLRRHVSRVLECIRYRTQGDTALTKLMGTLPQDLDDAVKNLANRAERYERVATAWPAGTAPQKDALEQCDYCTKVIQRIQRFARTPAAQQVLPVGKGCSVQPSEDHFRLRYPYPASVPSRVRGLQYLAAIRWMDIRDVLALCRWARLRIEIIRAECNHESLNQALDVKRATLPDDNVVTALTGYNCEGSWLVGVDHRTHSPNLAKRIIEEIASEHTTNDRGVLGAGIPCRKDFYEHHGRDPVPNIGREDLDWETFLSQVASTARRRERTVCSHVRKTELFDHLDHMVQHALLVADSLKTKSKRKAASEAAQSKLQRLTDQMVNGLFDFVVREMKLGAGGRFEGREIPCLTCATPELCRAACRP